MDTSRHGSSHAPGRWPPVLAAVDGGAVSAPVLAAARWLATALGRDAAAVHVDEGRIGPARFHAAHAGVPLAVLHGDPADGLLRAARLGPAELLVLGVWTRIWSTRPLGRVSRALVDGAAEPIVVVPPTAPATTHVGFAAGPRVLVPLDGDGSRLDRDPPHPLAALVDAGGELVRVYVGRDGLPPGGFDGYSYAVPGPNATRLSELAALERVDLIAIGPAALGSDAQQVLAALVMLTPVPIVLLDDRPPGRAVR